MTEGRKHLRVMVVDECSDRALLVERSLAACGHTVVARLSSGAGLREEVMRTEPDVIIIDVDSPDRDILEGMHAINRDHPRPIVVFAKDCDSATIETAVRAGVSAYVVDGLNEERVMPILEVAIARFREFQAMRRELAEARQSLAERKLVERAKGLLMQQSRLDENTAYSAMRKMAMDRNLRMADLARSLIAASELLTPPRDQHGAARSHPQDP
ncbi:MAG: ANTAR domain-containing response regulator [Gammaproteobacteria bacterium]